MMSAYTVFMFIAGIALAAAVFRLLDYVSSLKTTNAEDISIPQTNYYGQQWSTNHTMGAVTLASCKYGQFQSHTVKTESGVIAKNWLWTNDRDQVNILVI